MCCPLMFFSECADDIVLSIHKHFFVVSETDALVGEGDDMEDGECVWVVELKPILWAGL